MLAPLDLIPTLGGSLAAALLAGAVTRRLHLSPITGYVLVGVAVGRYGPGVIADRAAAEQLAGLAVILLLFDAGLRFRPQDVLAVRRVAAAGALLQGAVAAALGAFAAHAAGWGLGPGLVFGLALSAASGAVLVRVLADDGHVHAPAGRIAAAWLAVQAVLTALVVMLMPAVFGPDGTPTAGAVRVSMLKVVVLAGLTVGVRERVVPALLAAVARTRSRALLMLAVPAAALGIAAGTATVFDVPAALGALLAGFALGRAEHAAGAADALPIREPAGVLFFVSVGVLLDPGTVLDDPLMQMAALGVVLVAKPLAALATVLLFRYPLAAAAAVALALAPIGELSFVVAALGLELGALPVDAINVLLAAAVVSMAVSPLLVQSIHGLAPGRDRAAARQADGDQSI